MNRFHTIVGAISILLLAPIAGAQVPQIINYQGRVSVGGTNFDGTGQFKFALVDGGGTTNYWSNDGTPIGPPAAVVQLTVTKGLYSVLLGDTTISNMTAIPARAFANTDVRLRVWFNDGVHATQQLSPDQRLAAVGFAMMAGTVPAGAITTAQLASNAVTAANLAPGAVTAAAIANGAVGSVQLASNAVTAANIATGAITSVNLAGNAFSATVVSVFSNYVGSNFGSSSWNITLTLVTNIPVSLQSSGVTAYYTNNPDGASGRQALMCTNAAGNGWLAKSGSTSLTTTNNPVYWSTNGVAGPWYAGTTSQGAAAFTGANPFPARSILPDFPQGFTLYGGTASPIVTTATNGFIYTGPGCYIVRAGTSIDFGFDLVGWANAITNGDYAMVIGGQYNLTNQWFNLSGKSGVVLVAQNPTILNYYASVPTFNNGYPTSFVFDYCTNVTCLGDWNLRQIQTASFPAAFSNNIQMISIGGYATNVIIDGMHAQLESVNSLYCEKDLLVAAGGTNKIGDIVVKNCKLGYLGYYPGAETDTTHGAYVLVAHSNMEQTPNPGPPITLYNDKFYGEALFLGIPLNAKAPVVQDFVRIISCWGIDTTPWNPHPCGPTSFLDAYLCVLGTFDTNENLTYFLPGSPMPRINICPNSMRRNPPDWNTPTITNSPCTGCILKSDGTYSFWSLP